MNEFATPLERSLKRKARYDRFLRFLMAKKPTQTLHDLAWKHSANFNPAATWQDATIAIWAKIEIHNREANKPARVLVKVTCNTGKNWTTQINGDLQNATAYFIGQLSADECEITGKETRHVVTKVEEVQA